MNPAYAQEFAVFFPAYFLVLWLVVTSLLGLWSGWYRLMRRFPDQMEAPLLELRNQSGTFGVVGMSRVLTIGACHTGLRLQIMRIFGPFSRPFFVPWNEVSARRRDRFLMPVVELEFGTPAEGRLSLPAEVANRLARAIPERWPEAGPFPQESAGDVKSRLFKQWLAMTALASMFFLLAPRLMVPNASHPPAIVAVLFPAIVFGVGSVVQYLRRDR
jgi:hypothetical protein